MAKPEVGFLPPTRLAGYRVAAADADQPPSIPQTFLDAMLVRRDVFVREQHVPAENEFDADDARSCHWVVYAAGGHRPVGTVRLVPFPHDPHPEPNGKYWAGVLHEGAAAAPSAADRSTTFHDGKEPYIKLGRLAVLAAFRGNRLAGLLVRAALDWLREHPSYFDPRGVEKPGLPWAGLVCVHAQVQVVHVWRRWGFEVDEGMGSWWEEGLEHVGMFQRLQILDQDGS